MEPMRKLVIDMLLFEKGKAYGFQEYIFNLLNYLYEHRSNVLFDQIILVCLKSQREHLLRYADKFVILDYPCESLLKRFSIQTIFPFLIKMNRNDLLISPGNYSGLIKRSKQLLVIHDLLFKRKDLLPKPLMRLQRNVYLPISVHAADAIVCISEFTRQDLISFYPEAASKANTIYNYFNFEKFSHPTPQKYKNYFLSVCSEEAHKNTCTVLHAYDDYKKRGGSKKLVMVGRIIEYSDVAEVLNSFTPSVREQIITCSHISNQELASLYQYADAYISASLFEGLGMPIVEAMSFNLPVILSDIPVMHEISQEKGLYFNPTSVTELTNLMFDIDSISTDYANDIKTYYSEENTSRKYLDTINALYNRD